MDSISQFVLGAFVGEKVLGKELGKKSLFLGGLAATIPDLDFLFGPFVTDSFDKILLHRGLSHSLLFSFIFPLLFVFLFKKKLFFISLL